MGEAWGIDQADRPAGEDAEGSGAILVAAVEEELHAQADAEQRRAPAADLAQRECEQVGGSGDQRAGRVQFVEQEIDPAFVAAVLRQ